MNDKPWWMFLTFIFALNMLGIGKDFQIEFQMTWIILSLLGITLSDKFAKVSGDEQ